MARILVIEDEDIVRYSICKALRRAHHDVTEASNGKEGLAFQTQQPFDLVISDLIMPVMEGVETIMQLRKDFRDLPIIAISGGGRTSGGDYHDIAHKLGASRFLRKPFSNTDLVLNVEDCLKEKSLND